MKKQLLGVLAGGLLVGHVATADSLPSWLTERRIIGNNDLETIEKTAGTDTYERSRIVARVEGISDGDGFCTGSRVGKDLFLTNFHCYDYMPCDNLQFHLGYEKSLGGEKQLVFKCKEVLAHNVVYDYALYRVEYAGNLAAAQGDMKTFDLKDLDLAIPDNDPKGIEQTFAVDSAGPLVDLKLALKVDHSYPSDLKIELVSPSGKSATLRSSGENGIDKTFGFADGLRVFQDEEATGTWTLKIADTEKEDAGTLKDASLIVTVKSAATDQPPPGALTPDDYPVATFYDGELKVGEMLTVAGHPSAREKEIDRGADCKIRTIETEVVEERQSITHTCDTEGGSSGSPILDRDTGRLVALHWGGTDDYNLAIPIAKVLEDIKANVSAEAFSELKIEH